MRRTRSVLGCEGNTSPGVVSRASNVISNRFKESSGHFSRLPGWFNVPLDPFLKPLCYELNVNFHRDTYQVLPDWNH